MVIFLFHCCHVCHQQYNSLLRLIGVSGQICVCCGTYTLSPTLDVDGQPRRTQTTKIWDPLDPV